MRIRNHLRSNAVGYVALFVAMTGTAYAANTVGSSDIINGEVKSPDIGSGEVLSVDIGDDAINNVDIADNTVGTTDLQNDGVRSADLRDGGVGTIDVADGNLTGADVLDGSLGAPDVADGSLGAADLGIDSVAAAEVTADSIGSSEINVGVVGADELDTVHEHVGAATNVVDTTAHDGIYTPSTSVVACGLGEDLLSVSVDWSALGGHDEAVFSGVDAIDRAPNPETATVRVAWDGGAGPATYQAVATCIF